MDDLLLHPSTNAALKTYIIEPSHALCLTGPPGAGKKYLARNLALRVLKSKKSDNVYVVSGENNITIEQVRELQKHLRLKMPGTQAIRRAVVIEDANTMGDEAQNALLKTLEEPPSDTIVILTSDGSKSLKPTIYSRTQSINVLPLTLGQATTYFKAPQSNIIHAYHLSGGYAGLLTALLDDKGHELTGAIEDAKKILQNGSFERLILIDEIAKNKPYINSLLYALHRVIGAVLSKTQDNVKLQRINRSSRAVYNAQIDMSKNANPKLLLADLFLHL